MVGCLVCRWVDWVDGWMDRWMDGLLFGWIVGWMVGFLYVSGLVEDGWMAGSLYESLDGWLWLEGHIISRRKMIHNCTALHCTVLHCRRTIDCYLDLLLLLLLLHHP